MRVLVVEDAPRLANTIAEGLRDQAIAVDVAYDGEEALHNQTGVKPKMGHRIRSFAGRER